VWVIDPIGIMRAMIYYQLTTDRNIQQILRLVDALQATDTHQIATPANWQPSDKVIVPPPKTTELAEERAKSDYECMDWYVCKRDLWSFQSCTKGLSMACINPDGTLTPSAQKVHTHFGLRVHNLTWQN